MVRRCSFTGIKIQNIQYILSCNIHSPTQNLLKGTRDALGLILLHSDQRHVSATHFRYYYVKKLHSLIKVHLASGCGYQPARVRLVFICCFILCWPLFLCWLVLCLFIVLWCLCVCFYCGNDVSVGGLFYVFMVFAFFG